MTLQNELARWMARHPRLKLGLLFGSLNDGQPHAASDLDLAVMGDRALTAPEKMALIQDLARQTGRPVDLVDLQRAHGTILQQVLQTGTLLYCADHNLYAALIKRHLFEEADFRPYRDRILAERRQAWIGE